MLAPIVGFVVLPLSLGLAAAVVLVAVGAVAHNPAAGSCAVPASCVVARTVLVGLPILPGMPLCMLLPGMTSIASRTCPGSPSHKRNRGPLALPCMSATRIGVAALVGLSAGAALLVGGLVCVVWSRGRFGRSALMQVCRVAAQVCVEGLLVCMTRLRCRRAVWLVWLVSVCQGPWRRPGGGGRRRRLVVAAPGGHLLLLCHIACRRRRVSVRLDICCMPRLALIRRSFGTRGVCVVSGGLPVFHILGRRVVVQGC